MYCEKFHNILSYIQLECNLPVLKKLRYQGRNYKGNNNYISLSC